MTKSLKYKKKRIKIIFKKDGYIVKAQGSLESDDCGS